MAFDRQSTRRLKTRWTVRAAEVISQCVITVGGLFTIVAVLTVCVFLVGKVVPLFKSATVSHEETSALVLPSSPVLRFKVDEYRKTALALFGNGEAKLYSLEDGKVLDSVQAFENTRVTAVSPAAEGDRLAVGFADGSVRLGKFGFKSTFLKPSEINTAMKALKRDEGMLFGKGLVTRTIKDDYRLATIEADFEDPVAPQGSSSVVQVDISKGPSGLVYCVLTEDGTLSVNARTQTGRNELTDEPIYETSIGRIKLPLHAVNGKKDGLPRFVRLSELGDTVYAAWEDGFLRRISALKLDDIKVVEEVELLDEPQLELTALQFLIGKTTLMAGDSSGRIRGWFTAFETPAHGDDGRTLVMAHAMPATGAAVVALSPSSRTRMLTAGYADGAVRVFQVTSEQMLVQSSLPNRQVPQLVMLSPRNDGIFALDAGGLTSWDLDPAYPEATVRTLFLPVWYEGESKPKQVWQSGGEASFEPKLSLMPLIFGTLKGTFYAMLIGVPLALLAAVYTSEFMHAKLRALVKPSIELMAGLPSVVLGFLAGLIFAPFVAAHLAAMLGLLLTIPLTFLLVGHLWQLLPESYRLLLGRWRLFFMMVCLPAGLMAAFVVGPAIERLLFSDDHGNPNFRGWLDGSWSPASGWVLLLLPVCAVLVLFLIANFVNPRLDLLARGWSRRRNSWLALGKFLLGVVVTLLLAYSVGQLLGALHLDPRGSIVGTYEQKNSLVVGFAMGFAIIPIIYTIADDALTAVPAHLRSASLGCGATPWQTAVRIVLPTAASGLFSAVMIGLGRAVGETMIVLMAAGGTSIMDVNVFNGFRTLAANLATEMPEAVPDSTHARTLYLAALVLFGMTFVVNTVAEAVRIRFRKRALQL